MRRFDPLIDDPPDYLEVAGSRIPIDPSFRTVLAWIRVVERSDWDPVQKALVGIRLFVGNEAEIPDDHLVELHQKIQDFVLRGEKVDEQKKKRGPEVFSLSIDSGRILAAFLQVYRINLRTARIHWWVFCELLEGLPGGTRLAEVIDIRRRPMVKGMTPAQRNELTEAKRRYAINDTNKDPMGALGSLMRGLT